MENKKNLIIGLLIGVVVCLVVVLVIVLFNKNNLVVDNTRNIDSNIKEPEPGIEDKNNNFYSYNVENMYNSGNPQPFEKNVTVNGKNILLKYNDDKYTINSKSFDGSVHNFYIYDELIFVNIANSEDSLYRIYDLDGNLIKEINKQTDKYATHYGNISLLSDKLIVDVINDYNGVGPYIDETHYLCDCAQAGLSKSNIDKYMDKINNSNYFSNAQYQIIYNKNSKTFELKLYKVTETLKQYIDSTTSNNMPWCVIEKES